MTGGGKSSSRRTTTTAEDTAETTAPAVKKPDDAAAGGGGGKGIQGPPTTTYPPMTATTYGYKNTAGDWVTTEWYQSYTAPEVATATYAEGTIMDLTQYKQAQSGITAQAAVPGANPNSGAGRRVASAGVAAAVAGVLYIAL